MPFLKVVFLSLPGAADYFPFRKVDLRLFFTVKHTFFTIKAWPGRAGTIEKREG
jgi:hypothetical protein